MELSGPDDVEELLALLGLPSELVLAVYQYGSRVTGTAWAGSDWDFTIVVDDSFEPNAPDMCQGRAVVVGNVDANVHHKTHFIQLIRAHDMRALTCLWLPPQHVWRQTVDFASYFHLDLSVLRNPVSTISSKAFGYATICFREGHTHKAKKNLIHSIRYLLYGIQIVERGRIDDFSDGNEYYYALVRPVSEAAHNDANSCDDATRHSRTGPAPPADGGDVEGEDEEALRDEYRRIAKDTHARFDRLLPPKAKRPRKPRRRKEKNGGADARGGEGHDGDA